MIEASATATHSVERILKRKLGNQQSEQESQTTPKTKPEGNTNHNIIERQNRMMKQKANFH